MTGRIPIRSALSVVVVPGDPNGLKKETPTIAEFYQKNGYSTYFSGKWHLGDVPKFYPIGHGFDEMKLFAAYYPGVYTRMRLRISAATGSLSPIAFSSDLRSSLQVDMACLCRCGYSTPGY